MLIVDIIFIACIALSILAAALWRTALWGLGAWSAVSLPLGVLTAAVAAVIFAWQAAERQRLPAPHRGRRSVWSVVIACAAAFVLFWLLRARHDLWGERHAIAAAVEGGVVLRPGAPLATALNRLIYGFMNTVFIWNGAASSTLLSALAGTGFVAVAVHTARFITAGGAESAPEATNGTNGGAQPGGSVTPGGGASGIAAALIVANGFAVVFFGSGGNTAVAALTALLFLFTALRFVRGEINLIVPAVLFTLAVLTHLSALYLAPALIYCLWRASRSPGGRRWTVPALAAIVGCWALVEIVLAPALNVTGPARYLLSIAAGATRGEGALFYGDTGRHLLTALNGFLILGPVSAAALILLVARAGERRTANGNGGAEERLLAIASIAAICLFPLAARRIDGGLRWDIFASTGPAFALYTICALRRRAGATGTLRGRGTEAATLRRHATVLVALGLYHVLPLVICGVHVPTAENRLLTLPLAAGRGSFIMGERAFERGDYDAAFDRYRAAIEKDQENHAAHVRLGTIYMKRDNYIDAVTSYLAATKQVPENPRYRFLLAEAYIAKNWFEEAIDNLTRLTEAHPDSVRFWRRLGYARNHSHSYREAIAAYERALDLEPDNDENVRNLTSAVLNRAAELQKEEQHEEARALYERAKRLYPTDWRAVNNLAVLEMTLGNNDKAFEILRGALQMHPFVPQLNLNMGLVYEKRGEYRTALKYLQKSAELDPLHSGAGPHIERLMGILAEEE